MAVQAQNYGLAGGLEEACWSIVFVICQWIHCNRAMAPACFGDLFPRMPQGTRKLINALSLPWVQEARDQGDEARVRRMLKEAALWLCYNRIGYSKRRC